MSKEWSEARLRDLIEAQVVESTSLEFKAAGALGKQNNQVNEITKDITAFANAAGGTLILGMGQDKGTGAAIRIEPIDGKQFNPEWMDQLVARIRPRIADLTIHAVPIGGDSNAVVYVLEIPKGTTAHQATDLRYHKRRNTTVEAMEDYEIRDVMGRHSHPEIEVTLRILHRAEWLVSQPTGRLWWRLRNVGNVMARHVYLRIVVPYLVPDQYDKELGYGGFGFKLRGNERYSPQSIIGPDNGAFWVLHVSNEGTRPLFPQSALEGEIVFEVTLANLTRAFGPKVDISYTVFADEMPPKSETLDASAITAVEKIE